MDVLQFEIHLVRAESTSAHPSLAAGNALEIDKVVRVVAHQFELRQGSVTQELHTPRLSLLANCNGVNSELRDAQRDVEQIITVVQC